MKLIAVATATTMLGSSERGELHEAVNLIPRDETPISIIACGPGGEIIEADDSRAAHGAVERAWKSAPEVADTAADELRLAVGMAIEWKTKGSINVDHWTKKAREAGVKFGV